MAWFRKDPWKDERSHDGDDRDSVVVTDYIRDLSGGGKEPEVYLTFRFTDGQGAVVVHEHRLAVERVPAPGSIVDIAYMPNKLDTIDYDRQTCSGLPTPMCRAAGAPDAARWRTSGRTGRARWKSGERSTRSASCFAPDVEPGSRSW